MNQGNATEQYLQQLRNMGFNEDMIEMYRKQMTQYVDVANNWASQMKDQQETMAAAFGNVFAAGAAAESPEPSIVLNPSSALTNAEKWAIACGADVAVANQQYLNDVPTGLGKQMCRELLSDWWDIDSSEELQETISWLKEEGHRLQYDTICQALNTVSVKEAKEFLRSFAARSEEEEETVIERLRNMRDALELFREEGLIAPGEQPDSLIWDYARIINLSRAGYDAGYMEYHEALDTIMSCVPAIKASYTSWKQLSVAYQFARCVWNGVDEEAFKAFRKGMDLLLTHPESPRVLLPWNL
ncbi:hypothetical protein HNQ91_006027 [Filimonas zeae]|uniref:DUF1266 domain-containing protein n=1 Tax=Filimonas zeae TaxID=1737353 RepID=A0A917J6F0_9BACT|nr:DUF1266 domain-containing protein [Filimonas zeae]MDR6342940.1 hypothetical protein [Filimonas zeae]GGH83312.1 hypothetical protein GCM10011379_58510 [Filimonas zeae]